MLCLSERVEPMFCLPAPTIPLDRSVRTYRILPGGIVFEKRLRKDPLYKTLPWTLYCNHLSKPIVKTKHSEGAAKDAAERLLKHLYRFPRHPRLFLDLRTELVHARMGFHAVATRLIDFEQIMKTMPTWIGPTLLERAFLRLQGMEEAERLERKAERMTIRLGIEIPKKSTIDLPRRLDLPKNPPRIVTWTDHGTTVTINRDWLIRRRDKSNRISTVELRDRVVCEIEALEHAIGTVQKERFEVGLIRLRHACVQLQKHFSVIIRDNITLDRLHVERRRRLSGPPTDSMASSVPRPHRSLTPEEEAETFAVFAKKGWNGDRKEEEVPPPPVLPPVSSLLTIDWSAVLAYLDALGPVDLLTVQLDPQIALLMKGKTYQDVLRLATEVPHRSAQFEGEDRYA